MREAATDPVGAYADTLNDLLIAQHAHLDRINAQVQAHCFGNLCRGHSDDVRTTLAECFRLRSEIESTT